MKLYYEDELARAVKEDGDITSTYIAPKVYLSQRLIMTTFASGKHALAISRSDRDKLFRI